MNKSYRQGQILRLIRASPVYTQEALAHQLAASGIQTTQVTLSRDMRELGLVKTPAGYRETEEGRGGSRLENVAVEFLLEARAAQNLLVLKTAPGHASALAIALDQENWPEIVGTLAGDDTVLVIAADTETALTVRERLMVFVGE